MDADRRPERAFLDRLVGRVPEFMGTAKSEKDFYGEVIPHVFMASFARWFIEAYRASQSGDPVATESVQRVLAFLESEFADESRPAVRELIAASFLDNLTQAGPD